MKHIISLGAGVQSSTMALMAAKGELTPMPDCAVFSDTGDEPDEVYRWLAWLEEVLPFPVNRVSHGEGTLGVDACVVRTSEVKKKKYTQYAVPAFLLGVDGRIGLMMRQCTTSHKINPIHREYGRVRGKERVTQWIGISLDEIDRMKSPRKPWVDNRYPLIEKRMTRQSCLAWMFKHDFPKPPRSACVFCPYHNDREWKRMQHEDKASFARAVNFEKEYQSACSKVTGLTGKPFLHRTCQPLDQIDFDADKNQLNLFINECEGMCGV